MSQFKKILCTKRKKEKKPKCFKISFLSFHLITNRNFLSKNGNVFSNGTMFSPWNKLRKIKKSQLPFYYFFSVVETSFLFYTSW